MFDRTDIIVLVLMALFVIRRIEARATDPRCFPQVPRVAFDQWKAEAIRARTIAIHACFAKVALNYFWYFGFRYRVIPPVLAMGGWIVFLGWVFALTYAWWLSSGAKAKAEHFGIVAGRRIADEPKG